MCRIEKTIGTVLWKLNVHRVGGFIKEEADLCFGKSCLFIQGLLARMSVLFLWSMIRLSKIQCGKFSPKNKYGASTNVNSIIFQVLKTAGNSLDCFYLVV